MNNIFRLLVFISDVGDQRVNVGEHSVLNTPWVNILEHPVLNRLWVNILEHPVLNTLWVHISEHPVLNTPWVYISYAPPPPCFESAGAYALYAPRLHTPLSSIHSRRDQYWQIANHKFLTAQDCIKFFYK